MNAEVRMGGGQGGKKKHRAFHQIGLDQPIRLCKSESSCISVVPIVDTLHVDDIYEFQRLKPAQCHWHWSA